MQIQYANNANIRLYQNLKHAWAEGTYCGNSQESPASFSYAASTALAGWRQLNTSLSRK
jgi:hypothetical protein